MKLDIEQVDLMHKIMLAFGPKININQEILKNLLIAVAIFSDRDTGDEIKRLIRQM